MWVFGLGGAHSLALIPHVELPGILGFWEVPVHIVYGEQCLGEVDTLTDTLEPHLFGGKSCGRMEVSDCARQDWELINVVNSLP